MNNKWEPLALQWLDNALKAYKSDAELVSSGEVIINQLLTEAKLSAARIAELEADCKVMAEGLTCLIADKYREGK